LTVTKEQLEAWMRDSEGENLEFKEARTGFDSHELTRYCIALANERSGRLILGVTDKHPRRVVGTDAFRGALDKQVEKLFDRIRIRIRAEEVPHPEGRVVVFTIPSRPVGKALEYKGQFLMRVRDGLRGMTFEEVQRIGAENTPDFSAEINRPASMASLDIGAIIEFRRQWVASSGNEALNTVNPERLLSDAGLIVDGNITNAAMILFGTEDSLGQLLSVSEVIFEYRNDEALTPVNQRINFQRGFFLYFDDLIDTINLRNDEHNYIDGLFRKTIRTFNEQVIREAVLNAVSHREYRAHGSIFIRQYPRRMTISSPGGFPQGITIENIIEKQVPRNKLIALAFEKCGLVERSGQGVDRMFRMSIQEGKLPPDYSESDDYEVRLILNGAVQDENFVRFLEVLAAETQEIFSVEDFIVLDQVRRTQKVEERYRDQIPHLRDAGAIELTGKGRGTKYILSRKYQRFAGRSGQYTRQKGLDKEQNKALLEKHIVNNPGCQLAELRGVLPEKTQYQVQKLLQELKGEYRIHVKGERRWAKWYPGPEPGEQDE